MEKLEKPMYYTTINGINKVENKLVTPLPKEFHIAGTVAWKVINLSGRNYDAIIGQNLLKNLKAKIDFENNYVEIKGNKIMFIDSVYPFDINSIQYLEPSGESLENSLNLDHLNSQEREYLLKLLKDYESLFYKEGDILTASHDVQHEIITTTDAPIYSKLYRYPQAHEKEIERQIQEMLEQGIIKESNSPYNSPLWIVPKKKDSSGKQKWRIVIDYRKLNEVTVSDNFPIPNTDAILDKLGRAQYFSTIDLAKGFHQILVKPEDTKKNSIFDTLWTLRICMPFGLKNGPATFQRHMNNILTSFA